MSKTQSFPLPVLGVDTLSNETAVLPKAVRSAVNVDIGRAGRFKRRDGYVRTHASPDTHSLYYAQQLGTLFVCQGRVLNAHDPDLNVLTPVATLRSPDRVDFTEYNGNLYFTNRTTFGWIPNGTTQIRSVGVPTPATPELTPSANGGLVPGKYAVAVTTVDDRGEESGASAMAVVDLPDGGGIELTAFSSVSAGWTRCIYVSSADGDILRFVEEIPHTVSSHLVSGAADGGVLSTRFLRPLPPGDYVRWHNGRLYSASGNALYFSEALRPHLYNPAHGVIPFSEYISFVEPVVDGIYVGDARGVWFLSGPDPEKFELRMVSSCRAVRNSSIRVPSEHFPKEVADVGVPVALWLSTSGYVVGLPSGRTVELQPDRIRTPANMSGRSAFLLRGGRKQVITLVDSTAAAPGLAVDSTIN